MCKETDGVEREEHDRTKFEEYINNRGLARHLNSGGLWSERERERKGEREREREREREMEHWSGKTLKLRNITHITILSFDAL